MGQKQAQPTQPESLGCVIDHPRFRQARLLTDKQGESIQISVPVVSEGELTAWEKGFRALLPQDSLLLPLSFEFKRTELCGANGLCKVKFDNYPFLLREQISNRRGQEGKPFQNEQLWYLGLSLLQAGSVLHGRGEKIGDVQPGNIFINDNGQAKVACQHSWPHEFDNYQKTVFEKQITYLAPEEIKDLHFGLTQSTSDLATAESFSVGLTLLDAALLTDSTDLYSLAAYRIDYQKLEERRLALRAVNSLDEVLKQVVLGLTEVDPKERLNCTLVYNWMKQFREQIVNMEGFEIRERPPWMKTQPQERKSLQILKPPTQIPFYVDPRQYQPVIYEDPKKNIERIVPQRPPIISQPPPYVAPTYAPPPPYVVPAYGGSSAYRMPVEAKPVAEVVAEVGYPQEVGIYESSYVQVPTYAPTINKSDDFRSTLQKIDEQLAISRNMFP